jgi:hypothetical protein
MRLVTLLDALDQLRKRLLVLDPAGSDGFEGLIATALADLTGLVFRLAKSGSQFGRDASSTPGAFAIAMEAKRYTDDVSLETLAGKATIARQTLRNVIDLWVVAATSEVGDDTALKLQEMLQDDGITPLILDWTLRPLPPLAVLLAATHGAVTAWLASHISEGEAAEVAVLLNSVAAQTSFPAQVEALRASCTSPEVGLDALRRQASGWLRQRLEERSASRQSFGQFLTVNDQSRPAVRRQDPLAALNRAVASGERVIAVLGEEGTGKSWLVAKWWTELNPPPIPIVVAGRMVELLNARDPMEGLARLLSEQSGRRTRVTIAGWRRRLDRWADHNRAHGLRFMLVLDGLNEHSAQPWADVVLGYASSVAELGGILVVTSRTHFWNTHVRPRLGGEIKVECVVVPGYTADELAAVLRGVAVEPDALDPRVREFVSNPRVCTVAMHLLPFLHPRELTIERLLLEYWRHRLEERGDLLRHNAEEFKRLLIAHARDWLARPRRTFDVDELASRSGVAPRYGPHGAEHDLTEIQEGRFLTVVSPESGEYAFRPEVLPFALGVLILAEAQRQYRDSADMLIQHLELMLEPVRGFDIISEVIAAAVGLACLSDTSPPAIREVLIRMWCEQQNRTPEATTTISAYLAARPDAFFAVAERWDDAQVGGSAEPLAEIFLTMRDHPQLSKILAGRAARWLTQWSQEGYGLNIWTDRQVIHQLANRQRDREQRIHTHLAALSEAESNLFRRLTHETPRRPNINLHRLAALLLAGRSLGPHAEALVGWALTTAVAADVSYAGEELAWITRLNRVDAAETTLGVNRVVDSLEQSAASPIRSAAAVALRLIGDNESAVRARRFQERRAGARWHRVETFCDTDPHDPGARPCSNMARARAAIETISMAEVWIALGMTVADHNLEMVLPVLARFDPPSITDFLRKLIHTLPERRDMPLRQLAWRLPSLSPICEVQELQTIRTAFRDLLADRTRLDPKDFHWIAAEMVSAVIPHLPAGEQLDLMCELPVETPLFYLLRQGTQPLSAEELERRLDDAIRARSRTEVDAVLRIRRQARADAGRLSDGGRGSK